MAGKQKDIKLLLIKLLRDHLFSLLSKKIAFQTPEELLVPSLFISLLLSCILHFFITPFYFQ